jgi:hypothetical protein
MKTKKKKLFIGFCRGCLTEVSVKKKHVTENPPRNIFGKINSKYYTFCKKCNAKTSVSSNKTPKGGSATA